MTELVVAPRAEGQIRRVSDWWQEHRPSAPRLFATEVADTLELLIATPNIGIRYAERRGVVIRRVLLPRTRYHVYFSYDLTTDLVEVRAVWHGTRRRGPQL